MACGGYSEDRFQTSVDKNFFCPICTDVLKDPVQCYNQHLFCRACITEHLKNSQTCPVCMEKLTEEALSKPPRIVTNILDGLMINCEHKERGCVELVELGLLETHISVCEYKPVTCPNERCEAVVNMVTGGTTSSIEYVRIHDKAISGRAQQRINRANQYEFIYSLVRQLPFECYGHKTTILNDHLWLVGGYNLNNQGQSSNTIYMTPIRSTGTFVVKRRMPKPLSFHGLEIVTPVLMAMKF
ncbi:E3 ubiquitin- ligase NRDP1 [Paramuricea clavata]|uniref:E3 ubiquitin- ligase NRDP1 n=1 Tax=Paramuricea clavata TaxID=317549 RepID=A0A6S7K095_PARCT|nr:E3 ubiquitin- ligase NRDP1 [Paramuricea clavata]